MRLGSAELPWFTEWWQMQHDNKIKRPNYHRDNGRNMGLLQQIGYLTSLWLVLGKKRGDCLFLAIKNNQNRILLWPWAQMFSPGRTDGGDLLESTPESGLLEIKTVLMCFSWRAITSETHGECLYRGKDLGWLGRKDTVLWANTDDMMHI